MPTKDDLLFMQRLPLDMKIALTKSRIREWIRYFGESGAYVLFSGGKDSTVLLDIVRQDYPDVKAVFVDTGLEYPEIRSFVKTFDDVQILRPKMRFDDVIKTYGYPVISKHISLYIRYARKGSKWAINAFNGFRMDSDVASDYNKDRYYKYKYLLTSNFKISDQCCQTMKESPLQLLQKNNQHPITALLACESERREKAWLKSGCNSFDKQGISKPLSFWTEQDILTYIKQNNLPIASVYGDICEVDTDGNLFFGLGEAKLKCSGCQRTGCMFCGFGAHLEKGDDRRFIRLKHTHPKQYDYCINGGEYDISDGMWKPNRKGLGMGKVLDFIGVDF